MGLILAAGGEGEEVNVLALPLYEIIIGALAFGIVFFALAKFVLPKIAAGLDERANAIEGGIERAEQAQADAAAALAEYKEKLAGAADEAGQMRVKAEADAKVITEQRAKEASDNAAAIIARAEASIASERSSAMSTLQRDVGSLALALASKIVGESLEDDQRARATVDRFIAELEASAGAAPEASN